MSANTIELEELRRAAERVFDAVERAHGSSILVDEDYYWHLPVEDAYAMNEAPSIRRVGQLSDDLAEIRQNLAEDEGAAIVWHDLAHLIGVLRAVEKVSLT